MKNDEIIKAYKEILNAFDDKKSKSCEITRYTEKILKRVNLLEEFNKFGIQFDEKSMKIYDDEIHIHDIVEFTRCNVNGNVGFYYVVTLENISFFTESFTKKLKKIDYVYHETYDSQDRCVYFYDIENAKIIHEKLPKFLKKYKQQQKNVLLNAKLKELEQELVELERIKKGN